MGREIYFVTGNKNKADYLSRHLGITVKHIKLDLDEIQSLDLNKIVEHKARQAFQKIKKPVIVEDVSLEFEGLGGLPGPFVRFFIDNTPLEAVCSMVGENRRAVAKCVFGYYDGAILKLFKGSLPGFVSRAPAGDGGYGWDKIFVPQGYKITRAQLSPEEDKKTYLKMKPFAKVKKFLIN
jgi:non-canonical purine NTP pyrophosphatase (RdgB/HAM1 family)